MEERYKNYNLVLHMWNWRNFKCKTYFFVGFNVGGILRVLEIVAKADGIKFLRLEILRNIQSLLCNGNFSVVYAQKKLNPQLKFMKQKMLPVFINWLWVCGGNTSSKFPMLHDMIFVDCQLIHESSIEKIISPEKI